MRFKYKFIFCILAIFFTAKVYSATWTRTFGGSQNDEGYAVVVTSDSCYLVAGYTKSYGAGGADVWILKVDRDGNLLWSKTYGGTADECVYSIERTFDGGYILTGYTESFADSGRDVWLIKMNADGDTVWTRTFNTGKEECGYRAIQAQDSGYIITGYTKVSSNRYLLLIKTDINGNSVWTKTFDYSTNINHDYGYCVCNVVQDSGWIICGEALGRVCGIRTNKEGDTLWTKILEGSGWQDEGRCIQPTLDSNYVMCGVFGGDRFLIIKMNVYGDTLWTRKFHIEYSWGDGGYFIQQTQDSGYVATGAIHILKIDKGGNFEWQNDFCLPSWYWHDCGYCIRETIDGGYIITGATSSYGQNHSYDLWLIRTDPGHGIEESAKFKVQNTKLEIYPNPAVSWIRIIFPSINNEKVKLTLYDTMGRRAKTLFNGIINSNVLALNLTRIKSGVYFIKVESENSIETQKLIIIK